MRARRPKRKRLAGEEGGFVATPADYRGRIACPRFL
jgi:hypothetical protein